MAGDIMRCTHPKANKNCQTNSLGHHVGRYFTFYDFECTQHGEFTVKLPRKKHPAIKKQIQIIQDIRQGKAQKR